MNKLTYFKSHTAARDWCLIAVLALGGLLWPGAALAGTAYTLSTLTSGNAWTTASLWTTAGVPGTTPGVFDDKVSMPLGVLGTPWSMSFNTNAVVTNLTVTSTGAFTVSLNPGTPNTSALTLGGANPMLSATCGNTFAINGVNLDPILTGVNITKAGTTTSSSTFHQWFINNETAALNFFRALSSGGGITIGCPGTFYLNFTAFAPSQNYSFTFPTLTRTASAAGQFALKLRYKTTVADTAVALVNQLNNTAINNLLLDGCTVTLAPSGTVQPISITVGTGSGTATSNCKLIWNSFNNGNFPISSIIIGDQSFGGDNRFVFDPGTGGTLAVSGNLSLCNLSGANSRSANCFLDVYSGQLTVTNSLIIANTASTTGTDTQTGVVAIYGGILEVRTNIILGNATAAGSGKADLMLNSGALKVYKPIITANFTNLSANNRALVWLNGGTILAAANITNLFSLTNANDRVYVNTNGAVFDSSTFYVGVTNNLIGTNSPGGGLAKYGTGTLALSGNSSYTGTNNLVAGTLSISSETNWGGSASAVSFNGGILQITGTAISNLNTHPVNWATFNGGFNIAATNNFLTVTGQIGGTHTLAKYGSGTLFLNASNDFTGGALLFGGALRIATNNALGTGGITWDWTQTGDTRLELTGGITASNSMTLRMKAGGASGQVHILNVSGNNTLAGPITLTSGGNFNAIESASGLLILNGGGDQNVTGYRPLYLQGAGNGEVDTAITDSGAAMAIVKDGVGTWTLNAAMPLYNTTTVSNGTLALGAVGSINNSPTINVSSAGTFDVSAVSGGFALGVSTPQTLAGTGTIRGDVVVSGSGTLAGGNTVVGSVINTENGVISPGGTNTAATLTINTNLTLNYGNNLAFNIVSMSPVASVNNDLIAVGQQLNVADVTYVTLVFPGGVPLLGTNLLATFGSFAGSLANLQVVSPVGGYTYTFTTSSTKLFLVINSSRPVQNLAWAGDAGNNYWDINSSSTWTNLTTGLSDVFFNPDFVTFDDRSFNTTVNLLSTVAPTFITVTNTQDYTIADAGGIIAGTTGLNKTGSGNLTINTANTFSGPVVATGGTITINNGNGIGSGGALTLDGAALSYTGTAVPVGGFIHNLTLGASGGTIDQESTSGIFLFITNKISGVGALTKTGPQQLILGDTGTGTGSNDYSGITYINNGNLQIRNANALGSTAGKTLVEAGASLTGAGGGSFTNPVMENIDLNGGSLIGGPVNFGGSITIVSNSTFGGSSAFTVSGPISGAGSVTKTGSGTVTLLNSTATYAGGTVITGGTLLLGTNGTSGWIPTQPSGVALTNNGTLAFNRADTNVFVGDITGTGVISQLGSGTIILPGYISGGAGFNEGFNNQAISTGTTILGGANDFTGAINIYSGIVRVTNSSALGSVAGSAATIFGGTNYGVLELAGNINMTKNLALSQKNNIGGGAQPPHISNLSGSNAISGALTLGGGGNYWAINSASGVLSLTSVTNTANTTFTRSLYLEGAGDGTITSVLEDVSTNWLQIVKYGAGTWTIPCPATLPRGVAVNEGTLVIGGNVNLGINTSAASTVAGGTLLVTGQLPGAVTVSGGMLGGSGIISNAVTIQAAGTLSPGVNGIGILTLSNNLTISGKMLVEVNKALVQSNDFALVNGLLVATAGTVTVTNLNLGAPLVAGDRFTLFSKAVSNGNLLNIVGGGANVTWTNYLAVDGSITVLSVAPPVNTNAFVLVSSVTGNQLTLSWPDHLGWLVQAQTNALNTGLGNNWKTWTNTATLTNITITINPADPTVFYRMFYQ